MRLVQCEAEKIVVPQFVADYIENHCGTKPDVWDKADLIRDFDMYLECSGNPSLQKWVKNDDNFLTLIMAIITNDYEVEEKKYYWRKKKEYLLDFEDSQYLRMWSIDAERYYEFTTMMGIGDSYKCKFTESELAKDLGDEIKKLERVSTDGKGIGATP